MKYLTMIIFIMTAMIVSSYCISDKSTDLCEIKKVLKIVKNNDLYYMQVKFNHCVSKESRESIIKEELKNRFPLIRDKTIQVKEYLGKRYNEYKYEINVK